MRGGSNYRWGIETRRIMNKARPRHKKGEERWKTKNIGGLDK